MPSQPQDLITISIPKEFNIDASYPIAVLNEATNPELAQEFIGYILSPNGQAIIKKWGFEGATQ